MAVNFIALSTTCRKKLDKNLFARLSVLCEFLNSDYKAGRNKDEDVRLKVTSALESKGVKYSKSDYSNDKVRIRGAYLKLMGDENPPISIANKIINLLAKDGIRTWADVELLIHPPPPKEDVVPPAPIEEKLEQIGSETSSTPSATVRQKVLDDVSRLVGSLEEVLDENEKLRREAAEFSEESRQAKDNRDYILFLEEQVEALRVQLESAKDAIKKSHSESMEKIAESNPLFYEELMRIAAKIKNQKTSAEKQKASLIEKLPKEFKWLSESGDIKYSEHFVESLLRFTQDEQNRIIEGLEFLAWQGAEYPSLKTKKNKMRIPFSPPGCLSSRATDEIRFSWKKDGEVVIYHVYRRSNTTLRQSEG